MLNSQTWLLPVFDLYRPLVEEANGDPDIVFTKFKADMVERVYVKCLRGHTASDACEVCEAVAATKIQTPRKPKGQKAIHWQYPKTTRGTLRTHARFRNMAL